MSSPVGSVGSTEDDGPAATNGMPVGGGGERQRVGADLVGHVAVGGHAVEAGDHRVHLAAADQPGGGRVDEQRVRDARAGAAPTRSAARPAAAGGPRRPAPSRRGGRPARRSRPAPCRGPTRPARRCCSGSAASAGRRGARAPARRRRGRPARRWPPRPRAGSPRPRRAAALRAAAAGRRRPRGSTAQARLRAVGRARGQPGRRGLVVRRRAPTSIAARSRRRRRSAARRARPAGGSPPRCRPRRSASRTTSSAGSRVWSRMCSRAPSQCRTCADVSRVRRGHRARC